MINTNIWTFAWNGEAGRIGIFTEKTLSIEIVYFQVFHSSQWVLGGKKWVVSKALLYKEHFSTNVFRVLLRAIRVTTDNREWQEKKTGIQYPGCYLSKTFDPKCSSWIFNLQVCLHQRNSSPTKILISKLDWKSSQHQMTKDMLGIRYEKWVAPIYDFLF